MSVNAGDEAGAGYLRVQGVAKAFRSTVVIEGLDLALARGEFVSLLGPSGCGKTTLLRITAGLVPADRGTVLLDGADITRLPPHRRDVGVVFQNYALFPHLSVADNVAFGLQAHGASRERIRAEVPQALALVRMEAFAERPVQALSGGQQQRVAVARALAVKPKLLLLDEPLSALDRKLRETMQIELRRILRQQGITAIFVTHDQDEALVMSDRIAVMNAGRIEQIGSPEAIYEQPASTFVLDFVGLSTRIEGTVQHSGDDGIRADTPIGPLAAPGAYRPGAKVLLAVRPEHISIGEPGPGDNGARLLLDDLIYLGSRTQLHLRHAGGASLMVELAGRTPVPGIGETLSVRWPSRDTLVFPA